MLFNSYEFLFLFLPVALAGYFLLPGGGRLVFLTFLSYLFYGWWDFRFCSLMLISTLIDYVSGHRIASSSTPGGRKRWLVVSLASNLSLLGFFKYFDLAASTVNGLAALVPGLPDSLVPLLHVTLPVGISFYTFQSMSYSIDIYFGNAQPVRRFWDFAFYVSFFPQLIAGPIVRYHEIADQLVRRRHTVELAASGATLFVFGLAKKVILADGVAPLVAVAFKDSDVDFVAAWSGVLAYTMQIYFDFSGYSDMAVGLGRLFGFRFPQNFNSPYQSASITEFWTRWHISLSTWLRDYLYVPLGGNRKGLRRTYINLFLVMLLGGLWHGAQWTFVLWGGYHGVLLALERATGRRSLFWWLPPVMQRAATFLLVMVGWIFFRCASLEQAGAFFSGMVGLNGIDMVSVREIANLRLSLVLLPVCCLLAWLSPNTWEIKWKYGVLLLLAVAVLFAVSVMVILVNTSSPFLYFQF